MKNSATTVLLLALLCVDFACGLVLSGPPHVSSPPPPPPPPFANTYGTDSRLYRSYSSPSSLEHGVATWLASRNPNQSIRPLVLTTGQTASTDSSQKGDAWENAANVATVATCVGGGFMALRMDGREKGRVEREKGRDEREEGRMEREERWRVEDRIERRERMEREEKWRVEDNLRSGKQEIRRCKSTKLFNFLLASHIALSDSYVGLSCDSLFQINDSLKGIT